MLCMVYSSDCIEVCIYRTFNLLFFQTFLCLLKECTARMASIGQAFWYVRTWWRRWTGGKSWLWSFIRLSAGLQKDPGPRACAHTPVSCSQLSRLITQTIQSLSSGLHHYFSFILPAVFFQLSFCAIFFPFLSLRDYRMCDATWVHSVSTNQHGASQRPAR